MNRFVLERYGVCKLLLILLAMLILGACGGNRNADGTNSTETVVGASEQTERTQAEKELEEITFALTNNNLAFAPLLVAMRMNFFEDEGIKIKVADMNSSTAVQGVVAGNIPFTTIAGSAVIQSSTSGVNLLTIANSVNRLTMDMIVRNEALEKAGVGLDAPIKDRLQVLRGLRIGVGEAGTATDAFSRYYLLEGGLDPEKDAQLVVLGTASAIAAGLKQGQVDAFMLTPPNPQQLEAEGIGTILISGSQGELPGLDNFVYDAYATSKEYAEKNPEVVRAVARSLARGSNLILDHPDQALAVLQEHFNQVDPAILKASFETVAQAVVRDSKMDQAGWENALEIFQKAGLVEEDTQLDLSEGGIWTNQFVSDVNGKSN